MDRTMAKRRPISPHSDFFIFVILSSFCLLVFFTFFRDASALLAACCKQNPGCDMEGLGFWNSVTTISIFVSFCTLLSLTPLLLPLRLFYVDCLYCIRAILSR